MSRSFQDKLWTTWIPQLAVTEPTVWHALVSISLHHQLYRQRFNSPPDVCTSDSISMSALKEYNTALRCLSEFPSEFRDEPQYLCLQVISCVSFLTIEVSKAALRLILPFKTAETNKGWVISCYVVNSAMW